MFISLLYNKEYDKGYKHPDEEVCRTMSGRVLNAGALSSCS